MMLSTGSDRSLPEHRRITENAVGANRLFEIGKPGLLLVGILVLGLSACGRGHSDPFAALPLVSHSVSAGFIDAVSRYRKSQQGIEALSGRFVGRAVEGRRKRSFKQLFALKLPDSLRIEIETPVGQSLALFVSDGDFLFYREKGQDSPWFSKASTAAMERCFGYRLGVEELVRTLAGWMEPLDLTVGMAVRRAGSVVYLASRARPGRLEYGFDKEGGVLRSRTFYGSQGKRQVVVLYRAFTGSQGRIAPSRILIRDLQGEGSVELEAVRLRFNPTLSDRVFLPPKK